MVFVSHDNHSGQFEIYFQYHAEEGGTWLALPFKECREERAALASECSVSGIPTLTIIGPDGTIIAPNATSAVAKDLTGQHFPWAGASASTSAPVWIVIGMMLLFLLVAKLSGTAKV